MVVRIGICELQRAGQVLVTVVTGVHSFRSVEAWFWKAIPFQDWTRNAPGPYTRSRAGSVTVKNCFVATSRNSCTIPDGIRFAPGR